MESAALHRWAAMKHELARRRECQGLFSRAVEKGVWTASRVLARLGRRYVLGAPDPAAERLRRLKLDLFLADPHARLAFPPHADPLVSILVLNYNRADQLLECLQSIAANTGDVSYEVLLADNASTDRAPEVLRRVDGATVLPFDTNLGFVRGNNEAAKRARGRYLVLLNNDTAVAPGWLSALVRTAETWPRCGAVGPKFLFFDGRLQEAGAIVWADARVNALGQGADPNADEFAHVREVDFCSGACLLLRTQLFRDLGGLDDRYAPAYFEDVDLCFAVREHGLSVVYQPASVVFHHGPGAASVAKTLDLCAANRAKFVARWGAELKGHVMCGYRWELSGAWERRVGPRVLLADRAESTAAEDLAATGAVVTFLPLGVTALDPARCFALRQAGVEVRFGGAAALAALARARVGGYDAALVGDVPDAGAVCALLARELPATPLHRDRAAFLPARRAA